MRSQKDFESRHSLSPKGLFIGVIVGGLVFGLSLLLTGAAANLGDYSDPTVGVETTTDSAPVASTPQIEPGTAEPRSSPTVAKATGPETTVLAKQQAGPRAHSVATTVKR
jgi:hypothetical protein